MLWSAPDFGSPGSRPSRSGIPLLFPFAGRLRGQSYTFKGRTYHVTSAPLNNGNAIHGFVLNRPWRVVEQTTERAIGEFQASVDEPALLEEWPADFRITVAYEVTGQSLRAEFLVFNPDDVPLPCALGAHPYCRLPLGGADPGACRITVPAAEYWEIADGIPTGRRLAVTGSRNLTEGRTFRETELDDVLTGLQIEEGQVQRTIDDPGSGRRLLQSFDASFPHCVDFTSPHREAVAIEPYTGIPNPFSGEAAGVQTGLQVLGPRESFTAEVQIQLL